MLCLGSRGDTESKKSETMHKTLEQEIIEIFEKKRKILDLYGFSDYDYLVVENLKEVRNL
jgi:hypothetical protein